MLLRRISRYPAALLALMSSAALTWAMRNQLDSHVGSQGLETYIAAAEQLLHDMIANFPVMMFVLTFGLLAGVIISSGARRIDARLKSRGRWGLAVLKKEVGFSRMLCRRPWLGFLVQDMWEDLEMLSHQLVLRGLPAPPPYEQGDEASLKKLYGYLDVIHPHLTDKKLKYATLCGGEYLQNAGNRKPEALAENCALPASAGTTPTPLVEQSSPAVRPDITVPPKPGSPRPRGANRRRK